MRNNKQRYRLYGFYSLAVKAGYVFAALSALTLPSPLLAQAQNEGSYLEIANQRLNISPQSGQPQYGQAQPEG